MTEREADEMLVEAEEAVPVMQGGVPQLKRVRDRCLELDIPAGLTQPPGGCATGCSPQLLLVIRKDDFANFATMMRDDFSAMVEAEGTAMAVNGAAVDEDDDAEPPCPGCGTALPLVDGACSDCGLVLA